MRWPLISVAGYPVGSLGQDPMGVVQVDCRAGARSPGQAALAYIQYSSWFITCWSLCVA